MISTTHKSEASALRHKDDLQTTHDRFVAVVENIDCIGEWLTIYDESGTRIDRNALKAAQAVF